MCEWWSFIADTAGIISFVATIFIWLKIDRVKNEIKTQKAYYVEDQHKIYINLSALRESIIKDGVFGLSNKSRLRTSIYSFKLNFKYILSFKDRYHTFIAIRILAKPVKKINIESLCNHLDYLIARFTVKEVIKK